MEYNQTMRFFFPASAVILLFSAVAFADAPTRLERIVVTPSRLTSSVDRLTRSVTVLSAETLDMSVYDATPDRIGEEGGIDMRRRGVEGVQADVNIRGANFEENCVLIDGIKINDPQTGHFTMDLPVTSADIDRVEILKGPASSLYGPNSFGGTINIITKCPEGRKITVLANGGSFDYFSGAVEATLPFGPVGNRFSYEERRSTGYMPETEFNVIALSDKAHIDTFLGGYDFLFGYQKKDFGADSFYSNLYPNEEEHTDTRFFNISGDARSGDLKVLPNLFLRRHWDKFILDRNRPGWQTNYSTTYTYGGEFNFVYENSLISSAYGIELARDTIDSTNMQTHSRTRDGIYIEISPHIGDRLDLRAGFREDYSTDFGWEYAPSVSGRFEVLKDFGIKGSIARAYRIPTFTDLYYNDAANRGNPNLLPESSWSYEAGFDCKAPVVKSSAAFFHRDGRDTIDWTRPNPSSQWRASNIGTTDTNGFELTLEFEPNKISQQYPITKAYFSYTVLDIYAKHDYLSKYSLDYLKQEMTSGLELDILGFKNIWFLNYKKRVGMAGYIVADTKITKDIIRKSGIVFQAFFEISNLFDTAYSEQSNVRMPGRWVKSGGRLEF